MTLFLRLLLVIGPLASAKEHSVVRRMNVEREAQAEGPASGADVGKHPAENEIIRSESARSIKNAIDRRTFGFVDVPEELQWGIWIDGRDAHRAGKDAYGTNYAHDSRLPEALKMVYESAHSSMTITDSNATARMLVEIYARMRREFLQINWRNYRNPNRQEVGNCHSVLPSDFVAKIMATIPFFDRTQGYQMTPPYLDFEQRCCRREDTWCADKETEWIAVVTDLFQQYADKLPKDPQSDSAGALNALGWFLQNLAWFHPLGDKNGRSRLLLLQHELRRLGIAGGSFMYNNNKDVYFTPLDTFISKIREGAEMYNKAVETGVNPWTDDAVEAHIKRYDQGYNQALEACWHGHGTAFLRTHNSSPTL